ncbi:MAG: hypothetical protein IT164_20095 [Bryobacterales bacterium]|nr:hypothetical protein [Bryobacterales bacterium]
MSQQPAALHDRAMDNLRFIRSAMERAGSFTAVPGKGGMAMGAIALAAAAVAHRQAALAHWMGVWVAAAAAASLIGVVTMNAKATSAGTPLLTAPGRKFIFSFLPSIVTGLLLTATQTAEGSRAHLAGMWLLLYGSGVLAGGAHSIRIIQILGAIFLGLGACALFTPATLADYWLAAGFGLLQIGFGYRIARRYGG